MLRLRTLTKDTLSVTAAMVKQYNVAVSSHVVDMGDMDQIEQLPEAVITHHGSVDLVFNNAGVTVGSTFESMSETDWDWVMNINLNGVVKSLTRVPTLFEGSSRIRAC